MDKEQEKTSDEEQSESDECDCDSLLHYLQMAQAALHKCREEQACFCCHILSHENGDSIAGLLKKIQEVRSELAQE